jgi:hypothetical protein
LSVVEAQRSFFFALLVATLLLLFPIAGYGQVPDSQTQSQLIQALAARIQQLENRLAELEKGSGTAVALRVETPFTLPTVPAQPIHDHGAAPVPPDGEAYPFLKISGFTDLNFSATDLRGARSGFNEGQFILHFTSALSSRVAFFGELSMTARTDAGTGTPPATGFNVELERSLIRFDQSDQLKISFGRYHTPLNYWNNTFHHGSWLQTTISRPEMVQFGGSFIPIHFVGSLAEGVFPARGLNISYNAGVGNGRGSVISRGGDFGDINNNKAWVMNLFSRPDQFYGLQVGGSLYRDKITPTAGREVREWIESAHIVWQKENPELIAEFANVTHRDAGGSARSNSQAWYLQAAYRLPVFERAWKPYYRYEYIHIPQSDAIFRSVRSLAGSTAGIRYDLTTYAALKFEYRHQRRPSLPIVNGGFMQMSFTF